MRTAHTLFGKFCLLFMKGFDILKRVGLDIGSTTVKAAVLGENDELLYSRYKRHFSDIDRKSVV